MKTVRTMDWIALLFIIVGAINWGLIGFFQFDLVATLFGGASTLVSRIIYAIVGVSGIYGLTFFNNIGESTERV